MKLESSIESKSFKPQLVSVSYKLFQGWLHVTSKYTQQKKESNDERVILWNIGE